MYFMNGWEIEEAAQAFQHHPVLGPATRTLVSLHDAANTNSDGWAYWPKPVRAAAKLMTLIQGDREDATPAALRAALVPIKSFRTRSGIDFDIEVPS